MSNKIIKVEEFDYYIARFMLREEGILMWSGPEVYKEEQYMTIENTPENIEWINREFPFRNINYELI